VLDDALSALAHFRGSPQPDGLAHDFGPGELDKTRIRQVVKDSAAKEDLDADLARCRQLLTAAHKGSSTSRIGRGGGRRTVIVRTPRALVSFLTQISTEVGSPNLRVREALAKIQTALLLDSISK